MEGLYVRGAKNRCNFLIIQPVLPPGAPRTTEENSKLFVSVILAFFFSFVWNWITSFHRSNKNGLQSAIAEGWWILLCTEKDKDFSYSGVKIQVIESLIYSIHTIISEKQKIFHAFHPPPLPYAMNSRLQLAYSVAISAMVCHPLASPPHHAVFDFKSWTILQHLLMWFCK